MRLRSRPVRWGTTGIPAPRPMTPAVAELHVVPSEAIVFAPEDQLRVQVEAVFTDGSRRDVTDRACYELSNLNASACANPVINFGKTYSGDLLLIQQPFLSLQLER